jgi:hypothetical protein
MRDAINRVFEALCSYSGRQNSAISRWEIGRIIFMPINTTNETIEAKTNYITVCSIEPYPTSAVNYVCLLV